MRPISKTVVAGSLIFILARAELNLRPHTVQTSSSPASLILSNAIYERYLQSSAHAQNSSPGLFPFLTDAAGQWNFTPADSWTSGFFPGVLYLLRERQSLCPSTSPTATNTDWLGLARRWSEGLQVLANGNNQGHDQGFLAIPYVEELRINPGNKTANNTLTSFAHLLADRYSGIVRATRSWASGPNDFLVAIDNMMNLELLFKAASAAPNTFPSIAKNHANTTSRYHLRDDGSSFHVVDYSPRDGHVQRRYTAQGYADWSTWTRGQGWGVYGFAKMYEYTQDQSFLNTSLKMAHLFINRLASSPSTIDGVPPWDFDAPPPTSADTSAASVTAAGFMYLADGLEKTNDTAGAQFWRGWSLKLLSDTASKYFAPEGSVWRSILTNGTSFYSQGERNQGVIYGDYYFVEAGNLLLKKGLITCPSSNISTTKSAVIGTVTPTATHTHSSSIGPKNSDTLMTTHLTLLLPCTLFTAALLTL